MLFFFVFFFLFDSHELQTCDWPRNVGCLSGGSIAKAAEEEDALLERWDKQWIITMLLDNVFQAWDFTCRVNLAAPRTTRIPKLAHYITHR